MAGEVERENEVDAVMSCPISHFIVAVILSTAKNLVFESLRINSAKNLVCSE